MCAVEEHILMSTYKSSWHAAALIRELKYIFHYHVQIIVETSQTPVKLFISFHKYPELAPDAFVDNL